VLLCGSLSLSCVLHTLLRLPPAEDGVGGLGGGGQLDGHHLGLQEGGEVQLPQELPLDAVVGGELDHHAWRDTADRQV